MRSLRRNVGLLGLVGVGCVTAAHAFAAPAPTLFRLTIVGTAHQEWSFTAAPEETGDCRRTETSDGSARASFHTRAPVIVRLAGGRVLPVDVKGVVGTVTIGGGNTTEETCGGVGTSEIADCVRSKRAFTGARVHLASPRPGVVKATGAVNVRLATVSCPREPVDVRRGPLGPPLNIVRLPSQALREQRLGRMTLRASRTQHKVYGSPQSGTLVARTDWTLKFVRAKG
ncbi:MAG: hypothetical protein QOE13_2636 [Gaiellaceae bacterium]|nr:hypothetical protein [Gaiellaceae bacterium]